VRWPTKVDEAWVGRRLRAETVGSSEQDNAPGEKTAVALGKKKTLPASASLRSKSPELPGSFALVRRRSCETWGDLV
jgi:hypothetical protein